MPAAKSLKASEKQTIVKKLVTELKKKYGGRLPKENRPVLETLLFSACLEDVSHEQAEAAFERVLSSFFDLNEVRVSSVTEIQDAMGDVEDSDWKAMRLRDSLQYAFETYFEFDLEQLKRKTLDAALKELEEVTHLTPFMRFYTVQHALGAHVLPIDAKINDLLIWLALVEPDSTPEQSSEDLKSAVKKADGPLVCYLLKCAATDEKLRWAFEEGPDEEEELDPFEAASRLSALIKNPKPKKKAAPKKSASEKAEKPAAKKSTKTKATKSKAVTKKKPTKTKPAKSAKKASSKKTVTKKKPAKKKTTKRKK